MDPVEAENWRTITMKMGERILAEFMKGMVKKNEENIRLKKQNEKLQKENSALKRKMERIETYFPNAKKLLIRQALPAELVHELFASLPLENAFSILIKLPNKLLARNVRKMLKGIKMIMKNNKWNVEDCGPNLIFLENRLIAEHSGPYYGWNCVRTELPIPMVRLRLDAKSIAQYFEVEILKKHPNWYDSIRIGFCTQQFPLYSKSLGDLGTNSIGIYWKEGIHIDGSRHYFRDNGGYFEVGDVIGLGIFHLSKNSPTMKCFATCNGKLLGITELPEKFTNLQLFPTATIFHVGDSIRANFGNREWVYSS